MKQASKMIIGVLFFILIGTGVFPSVFLNGRPFQNIENPGSFIYETIGETTTLDPAINYDSFGSGINELVYETLVDYIGNSPIELEGRLATSWTVSPNGLQYNFTLRPGVLFHDGVKFNAYVMKYSLDRAIIMNSAWGPNWMLATYIRGGPTYMEYYESANITNAIEYLNAQGIVVTDDFHLTINLEAPYTPFLKILAYRVGGAVSPKAIIEHVPSDYVTDQSNPTHGMVSLIDWFPGLTVSEIRNKLGLESYTNVNVSGVVPGTDEDFLKNDHDWMVTNAVGTGPYKLVFMESGSLIQFEKNWNWWGTFSEHSVDKILIRSITEVESRISNIQTGEADQILVSYLDVDQIIDVEKYKETGLLEVLPGFEGVNVYSTDSFSILFFMFNLNNSLPTSYVDEHPTSVYTPSLWSRYSWGTETASRNPFTALAFRQAFALSFDYQAYINDVANGFGERLEGMIPNGMFGHHETLIEDGFIPEFDPKTAKTLFEQIGWKGQITLVYNEGSSVRNQACTLLREAIETMNVGITINATGLMWPEYLDAARSSRLPIFYFGWEPDYSDPDDYVPFFIHSTKGNYADKTHFANPNLDILIDNAALEANQDLRRKLYHEIEEIAAADFPFMYGYQQKKIIVIRSWLQNYEESGSFNPVSYMFNAEYINKIGEPTVVTTTIETTTIEPKTTMTEPTTTIDTTTFEPTTTMSMPATEHTTITTTTTATKTETVPQISPSFLIPSVVTIILIIRELSRRKRRSID